VKACPSQNCGLLINTLPPLATFVNWAFTNFQPDIPEPDLSNARQISAWRNSPAPDEDPIVSGDDNGSARAALNISGDNLPDQWRNNEDNDTPGPAGPSAGRFTGIGFGHYEGEF
jgi:hypothetical protein